MPRPFDERQVHARLTALVLIAVSILAGCSRVRVLPIVVGNLMLFLRPGEACHFKIGTTLQIVYVEQDGRSDVKSVIPVPRHARQ
jgi:hypothetical protein